MGAHQSGPTAPSPALAQLFASRLRTILARRDVSVEQLAFRSGLDEALLWSLVSGDAEPTIDLLWKISNALGVRLGSLLSLGKTPENTLTRAAATRRFVSRDGQFVSRVLTPFACGCPVEFYGITLAAGAHQRFEAHPPHTIENLVVHAGAVEVVAGREPAQRLEAGDSIQFAADVPHSYRNTGPDEATLYLVMTYRLPSGA